MKNEYFELGSAKHNLLGKKIQDNNYDYNEKEYIFDPNKQNDSHTAIVRQIKEQSTVLDIGCASGIIGSILYKYKNCIVDGIEYDKTAYEVSIISMEVINQDEKEENAENVEENQEAI